MRAALLALLAAMHSCWALNDGLALRPPLGINTWNVSLDSLLLSQQFSSVQAHRAQRLKTVCPDTYMLCPLQAFHDEINETLVKETADLLVGRNISLYILNLLLQHGHAGIGELPSDTTRSLKLKHFMCNRSAVAWRGSGTITLLLTVSCTAAYCASWTQQTGSSESTRFC